MCVLVRRHFSRKISTLRILRPIWHNITLLLSFFFFIEISLDVLLLALPARYVRRILGLCVLHDTEGYF